MAWQQWIERNPAVLGGKPVAKGTRISAELILERLGDGWSEADLLASFPHLRPEHIRAAQAYASALLATDDIVEVPTAAP